MAERVARRFMASLSRYCHFYLATDDQWYMELAPEEYGERESADTYGPFPSFEDADNYLTDNFSNPGGDTMDKSGREAVPRRSPNGRPVQKPRRHRMW